MFARVAYIVMFNTPRVVVAGVVGVVAKASGCGIMWLSSTGNIVPQVVSQLIDDNIYNDMSVLSRRVFGSVFLCRHVSGVDIGLELGVVFCRCFALGVGYVGLVFGIVLDSWCGLCSVACVWACCCS